MTAEEFKHCVQSVAPHVRDLAGMVKAFETQIASKRRSSLIQSFEELVMLLVRRLVVDPDDESTWSNLNNLCMRYAGQPFYTTKSLEHPTTQIPQCKIPPRSEVSHPSSDLLDPDGPIVNYLSTRIRAASWRNFARGLKVSEGDIIKIEMSCGMDNHEDCVKAVLNDYKKNLPWASASNGDVIKDIFDSLKLLNKKYLLEEFQRLTGRNP